MARFFGGAPAADAAAEAEGDDGAGGVEAAGLLEIAKMSITTLSRKLVHLQNLPDEQAGDAWTPQLVAACLDRVIELSEGGGGGFATDKTSLPAMVALMHRHQYDAAVQMRGCVAFHKILCKGGMGDTARSSGALRAIVHALQMLTCHGVTLLRVLANSNSPKDVEAVVQAIKEVCDDDPKVKKPWKGFTPKAKGFFALGETTSANQHVQEATSGKAWSRGKWSVVRGI